MRFETPTREVAKFTSRLKRLGAVEWRPESRIVELCCGRGNGLRALEGLGFERAVGLDLSPSLLAHNGASSPVLIGDCRRLPLADASKDVVIVQGGLHHLEELPQDLERTLAEVRRVLRDGGLFVAVEPWATPFLSLVHFISELRVARALSGKLDAFATMVEHERGCYERWLENPSAILALLRHSFEIQTLRERWGKLEFAGLARKARG